MSEAWPWGQAASCFVFTQDTIYAHDQPFLIQALCRLCSETAGPNEYDLVGSWFVTWDLVKIYWNQTFSTFYSSTPSTLPAYPTLYWLSSLPLTLLQCLNTTQPLNTCLIILILYIYSYAMPAHLPPPFYGYFQTPMQLPRIPNLTSSNIGSQNPNLPLSKGAQNRGGHGHSQWKIQFYCKKFLLYPWSITNIEECMVKLCWK